MALPNYIASINYAKTLTDLNEIIIVIPIISNDFDESFQKYAIKGRRGGSGQFYFNNTSEKMDFVEMPSQIFENEHVGYGNRCLCNRSGQMAQYPLCAITR